MCDTVRLQGLPSFEEEKRGDEVRAGGVAFLNGENVSSRSFGDGWGVGEDAANEACDGRGWDGAVCQLCAEE
ncbi:hypothetical protein AA106556_0120 [Neokomagataea tanensis NBRC 106556]|uniref:Uncharacterized protein n=1 Tax=Neokomagataea tanensis NBRC 106556 TaxID=1223519 RepID=A0ABQ0QG40_9PROT|nr:hypothetical protein AA106556_0120 [Neokomagataea tanensis NBRC 106556]